MSEDAVQRKRTRSWTYSRVVFSIVILVGVYLVSQFLTMTALMGALIARDAPADVDSWTREFLASGEVVAISSILTLAFLVPTAWVLARTREPRPWRFLGLTPTTLRAVALSCAAIVAFIVVSDAITVALDRPFIPDFMQNAYRTAPPALLFFALTVTAPVGEELLFRGFLMSSLEASGSGWVTAALVSSGLFALVHMQYDVYGVAIVFLMGMLFAAMRHYSGSVIPCIAAHALSNGVAFVATALSLSAAT